MFHINNNNDNKYGLNIVLSIKYTNNIK